MFSSPSLSDLGVNTSKRERKQTKSRSSAGSLGRAESIDEDNMERERRRIEHENMVKNLKKKKMLENKARIKELEQKISELPTQEQFKQALLAKEKAEVETAEIQERNNELSQEMEELKLEMQRFREEKKCEQTEELAKKDETIRGLKNGILYEQSQINKLQESLAKFQTQLREEMIDKENRLSRIEKLERDLQLQKQEMEVKLKGRIEKLKEIHTQENQYLEGMLRSSSQSLREAQNEAKTTQERLEKQILSLQQRLASNTDDKERKAQQWKQKENQLRAKHELELSEVKARLTRWGHDLADKERRKEADEAQSREARLKNDLRIAHDNYEKLSERSEERMSQMESILDEMETKSKPAADVIGQWKQYRQMMEDHVDNLNDLIADLREQLQVATQTSPKAGGAARESLIIDLDAEPALPAVSVDDDDDNPVSPEAKKWGKIQRMMSSINLALGGDSNSSVSTPRRTRSHEDARDKHASAKLQQENKKLKWKLEQIQFQLEKRMTDAKHRQHRVQMRQDDDLEEWKRKKQLLEARIQKYKSEIAHMKNIIQERDHRINDCNQKMEKQQEGLKVLREESEKYAREKKHWQDQCGILKQKEKEHEAEMNNVEFLKQQNIKLAETIQTLSSEQESRREEEEKLRIMQELAEARKTTLADGALDSNLNERLQDLEKQNKKLRKEKHALISRIKTLSTKPANPEDLP